MASRSTTPGTSTTGTPWTEAEINSLGGGSFGYDEQTSSQTGVGTGGVTVVDVTVTVLASRRIKVTVRCAPLLVNTGSPNGLLSVTRDGTPIGDFNCPVYGTGFQTSAQFSAWDNNPGAGSHTYALKAATNTGTMDITSGSGADASHIEVEDVGPSY